MIEKIKIKGTLTEVYVYMPSTSLTRQTKFYSSEERHPDLVSLLDQLAPHILKLFDLPLHWAAENNIISTIDFIDNDIATQMVIILKIKLPDKPGTLIIETPKIIAGDLGIRLIEEAENFINGKRAQADMFSHAHDLAKEHGIRNVEITEDFLNED